MAAAAIVGAHARRDPDRIGQAERLDTARPRIKDIMRRRVVALEPRDPVTTAIDRMLGSRLRSLPVVEGRGRKDVLVGIVSRGDVIRSLIVE